MDLVANLLKHLVKIDYHILSNFKWVPRRNILIIRELIITVENIDIDWLLHGRYWRPCYIEQGIMQLLMG